ncbi:MAG TPA: transporter [Thermohalobaculum sp.]|nr:transporter [Thermohalobaculum sp.]
MPYVSWVRSGEKPEKRDGFVAAIHARTGLSGGWMLGADVPLSHAKVAGQGANSGFGDASVTLWKELVRPGGAPPSLIGSLRYSIPTGEDSTDDDIALGSGYHRLTAGISGSKPVKPIRVGGNLSYTYTFARDFDGQRKAPGDVWGLGTWAGMTVRKGFWLSAGLNFAFVADSKTDGVRDRDSGVTVAMATLGTSITLAPGRSLSINGAIGLNGDSADAVLSVALPINF